jgi:hypothetical protein
MACRPPIIPKSKPYWNGLKMTTPQAMNNRVWLRHESPLLASTMVLEGEVHKSCICFLLRRMGPLYIGWRSLPMADDSFGI